MNTSSPSLSPSERRTLQQVANRQLHHGVGWDWVALQRLTQMGLVEDRNSGPALTQEGKRTLQRLLSSAPERPPSVTDLATNRLRHPPSELGEGEGTDTSFDWGYVRISRRSRRSRACTRPMSGSPRRSTGS